VPDTGTSRSLIEQPTYQRQEVSETIRFGRGGVT